MPLPRPRVSLLTLMLLMTIVAMGLALWKLNSELVPLRIEVRGLRDEVGQLTIDDPERLHSIEVDTGESDHWRWRVYIPQKGNYGVHCFSDYVPSQGIPKNQGTGGWHSLSPGEHRFDMRLVRVESDADRDVLKVRFTRPNGGISNFTLYEVQHDWIFNEKVKNGPLFASQTLGMKTKSFDPKEQMVLLRLRARMPKIRSQDANGKVISWSHVEITEPCEGLMIWIDQQGP